MVFKESIALESLIKLFAPGITIILFCPIYGDQNRKEALTKDTYLEAVGNATNIILEASLNIPI